MSRLLYKEATQFYKAIIKELKKLEGCKDTDITVNISEDRKFGSLPAGENVEISSKLVTLGINIAYYGAFPKQIYALDPEVNANTEIAGITVYMTNLVKINDPTGKCKEHFYAGSKEVLSAIAPFINKEIKMLIDSCKANIDEKNKVEKDKNYQISGWI